MKRIISCMLALCLILMVGCNKKDETSDTSTDAPASATDPIFEPQTQTAPYAAVSLPIVTEQICADDQTVIFTKSYQNMSLTLTGQATADAIILDFMNKVDTAVISADATAAAAKSNYTASDNWIPYSFKMRYEPTRIDSGVLSLYGSAVTYAGAAHPEYACISANYNLISGDSLTLGSILTHEDKIGDLRDLVVQKLSQQAQEKFLQTGYEQVIDNRFAADVSYDDDWYFSETGLCFYFAPYEIAPYSSGVIIAEIPYAELVGIIADEFFPAENSFTNGTASVAPFSDEKAQSYNHISELILDNDGQMFFVEADSCITGIMIYVGSDDDTGSSEAVYMAYYLNPGDAIMVQVLSDKASAISVCYDKNGTNVSIPLVSQ